MPTLEHAIALAAHAHAGQEKRGREPFVLHVLRVILRVDDPEARMVAALHDVVEKTEWTLEDLADEGFPAAVVRGVDAMTRREGESWNAYLARAVADPLGRQVKRADVQDNLEHSAAEDTERVTRYREALKAIG